MSNIKLFASSKNWIDSEAIEALNKISKFDGVKSVVGLPDLSIGNMPNGIAVISHRVHPHLIGGDIGCGMSLFKIDIKAKRVKVEKFAKKLEKLDSLDTIFSDLTPGYNIGTIGKGNHFAEFLVVNESKSKEINKDSLYLLIHSGSRAFGQIVFNSIDCKPNIGYSEDEAKEYLQKHNKAIALAKENRELIAKRLLKAVGIKSNLTLISDTAHNSITKVSEGFLHRKGATPTNKGLVAIAGSRGSLSYLVEPTNDTQKSNYSLSHGAGRKISRSTAEAKLKASYSQEELKRTKLGSRVVCKDKSLLYQEAPQVYKDIEVVIGDLVDANLAKVVASFKPILTYKE